MGCRGNRRARSEGAWETEGKNNAVDKGKDHLHWTPRRPPRAQEAVTRMVVLDERTQQSECG